MTPAQRTEALLCAHGILSDLARTFPREEMRLGYVSRAANLLIQLAVPHCASPADREYESWIQLLRGPSEVDVAPLKKPCGSLCDSERFGCYQHNYGFPPTPFRCKKAGPT